MNGCCGLDFGTSNSTLGLYRGDGPALVALEGDAVTIPSALFFSFEDDRTYFGRAAIAEYVSGAEGRHMRSLKNILGTGLMSERTRLRSRAIEFRAVIGTFLRHLKRQAEAAAGAPLRSVTIGRPVFFVDDDTEADRLAEEQLGAIAAAQGFEQVAFQYEPIAAGLAYERSVRRERLALIVDMGGGTSDFSVIRLSPERHAAVDRRSDILASHGVHVAGTDFDRALCLRGIMPLLGYLAPLREKGLRTPAWLYAELSTWQKVNFLYTGKILHLAGTLRTEAIDPVPIDRLLAVLRRRLGHALLMKTEAAKVALTAAHATAVDLAEIEAGLSARLARAELEDAIRADVAQVESTIRETLRRAGIDGSQVEVVFLTGGSSAVPMVQALIRRLCGPAELVEGDLFGSVGLGLTIDAARRFA